MLYFGQFLIKKILYINIGRLCESELMSSIYSNYSINNNFAIPRLGFKSNAGAYIPITSPVKDGYVTNPLYGDFGTAAEIEMTAKSNPRIREILSEYDIPLKVNEKELEKLKNGHLLNTRITSAKIYSNLPADMKKEVNLTELQDAAMFHDYGKVLIPESILNKDSQLSDKEWAIMQQHSEIGAELLKNKNLPQRTLDLIKYHHNLKNAGYPKVNSDYQPGIDSEIIYTADKYQALVEDRSYKKAMSPAEALEIIQKDVQNGLISQDVFNALKKSV